MNQQQIKKTGAGSKPAPTPADPPTTNKKIARIWFKEEGS